MNYQPTSKVKDTINNGIGRFPHTTVRHMRTREALEFMEAYCVCPELYQDLVNAVQNPIVKDNKRDDQVQRLCGKKFRKLHYTAHCSIVASHNVLKIEINRWIPCTSKRWEGFGYCQRVDSVYVRITKDGLIADILDETEVPKFNPGNLVTISNVSEASLH